MAAHSHNSVKATNHSPTGMSSVAPKMPVFSLLAFTAKLTHTASITHKAGANTTAMQLTRRSTLLSRIDSKKGRAAQAASGNNTASAVTVICPPGKP